MAWGNVVTADSITDLTFTWRALQVSAADWKLSVAPNEIVHFEVKCSLQGVEDLQVRVFVSTADSPGAVPDDTQTIAGSDWAIYQMFRTPSEFSNEFQYYLLEGGRTYAFAVSKDANVASSTLVARASVGTP